MNYESEPTPLFTIEETVDRDGTVRVHGYWDEIEARNDFEDFRQDQTVIAADLYDNTSGKHLGLDFVAHVPFESESVTV